MTKYCAECGKPNDDEAIHCNQCGAKFDKIKDEKSSKLDDPNSGMESAKDNKSNFKSKLPLILAILAIVIGVAECLSTPMLFGFYNIMGAMLVVIIGGLIGLYLMRKNENFIAGLEFIAIAVVLFVCIAGMGTIGTILFILTALSLFYLKGMKYSSKKLLTIPVLTIILVIGILVLGGSVSFVSNQNSIEIGNMTQSIDYDYGYYSGTIDGDIHVDTSFSYLEVYMDFYDESGKIVYSTIAWNEVDAKAGEIYHFSGQYFDEIKPSKVVITVNDNAGSDNHLYEETLNLTAPVK